MEGKNYDRYFTQRLCDGSARLSQRGFEVRTVGQVLGDNSAGGKTSALAIFDHAKRSSKLSQSNARGRRSVAFVLDRDAQHITGGRRRSPHVIYTEYADTEAQAFHTSHEVNALANSASLDARSAEVVVRNLGDWRTQLANDWRSWIELCYVAEATRARCWVGFSHDTSKVHTGRFARTPNPSALAAAEVAIKQTSVLSADAFETLRSKILAKIDAVYMAGQQSSLLRGKWLPRQLAHQVSSILSKGSHPWHSDGFHESVTRCYMAHIQVGRAKNKRMVKKLEALTG
ncbi:hypothetical protein [Geodermatophilus sp. SYSU D00698]